MKTLTVKMVHVRYSLLAGLAWLAFWGGLVYFLGALQGVWPHQWTHAHWWWVASAVLITLGQPFKTVVITHFRVSTKPVPPDSSSDDASPNTTSTSSKP